MNSWRTLSPTPSCPMCVFIADLADNYYTRAEAIDLLKMPPSTFHEWTKTDGIGFVLIGKVSLFRKDVIMAKRRAG